MQGTKELKVLEGVRDFSEYLTVKSSTPVELCWEKTDRKSKKVNFLVTMSGGLSNEKATVSTVEELTVKIEDL